MKRTTRHLLPILALAALALAACGETDPDTVADTEPAASESGAELSDETTSTDDGELTSLVVAEPVRGLGYLPMYVAQGEGFFEEEGLDVEFPTLAGGGHASALLSGEAWAFIGGPESGAVANVRGADTITIANVVNRGNVYLVASPDLDIDIREYAIDEIAEILEGRSIITSRYGGTPNAIMRHTIIQSGLDPAEDVELSEIDDSGAILASMSQGNFDFALTSEPQLTQGIRQGIWTEPVFNAPQALGPYAYSAIVTTVSSLEEDPEIAERFLRGLARGQQVVENDPDRALEIAMEEFPTMEPELLEITMDRSYADSLWESSAIDATVVGVALDVARSGEILQDEDDPLSTESMYDAQFIDRVLAELGIS